MKIEVKIVKENADGSADADIWLDEEAKEFLMRRAIIAALQEAVDKGKEFTPKEQE